jgi:hypothetical protein
MTYFIDKIPEYQCRRREPPATFYRVAIQSSHSLIAFDFEFSLPPAPWLPEAAYFALIMPAYFTI